MSQGLLVPELLVPGLLVPGVPLPLPLPHLSAGVSVLFVVRVPAGTLR